jgi:DNA uptake protein ComE-like DNA-binding protein
MPQPPTITPEQRQAALAKAAEARRARAEIKERLKMGTVTLAELLEQASSDDVVAKLKVAAVLQSLPGVGKVKAAKLLESLQIAEDRRLGGLGPKQRERLLAEVGGN